MMIQIFWLRIIPEDERKNIPEENTKSIKRKKKNNPKEVDKKLKIEDNLV